LKFDIIKISSFLFCFNTEIYDDRCPTLGKLVGLWIWLTQDKRAAVDIIAKDQKNVYLCDKEQAAEFSSQIKFLYNTRNLSSRAKKGLFCMKSGICAVG
jgi:hypothetical protein